MDRGLTINWGTSKKPSQLTLQESPAQGTDGESRAFPLSIRKCIDLRMVIFRAEFTLVPYVL